MKVPSLKVATELPLVAWIDDYRFCHWILIRGFNYIYFLSFRTHAPTYSLPSLLKPYDCHTPKAVAPIELSPDLNKPGPIIAFQHNKSGVLRTRNPSPMPGPNELLPLFPHPQLTNRYKPMPTNDEARSAMPRNLHCRLPAPLRLTIICPRSFSASRPE